MADRTLRGSSFSHAYCHEVDTWLRGLFEPRPGVALVAVGASGREELCPQSDLDLVVVHDGKVRDIADVASRIWYPVWDAGFALDHSVRTVREALKVSDSDLKAALGLLDARLVAGDEAIFAELTRKVGDAWHSRARDRLRALSAMADARHSETAEVAFALEPDLKNGKGGIRDLAMLRVLATVTPVYEFDPALGDARETILATRVALQQCFGRTDRLLLEYQDQVADVLDVDDADALMAQVSVAARTVDWQSDEAWRSVRSWLSGPRGRSAVGADVALGPGLVSRDREIAVLADASAADDASLVFRAAAAAAHSGVPIARATLHRFAEELPLVGRWSDATREGFVALLGAGDAMVEQFETLDRYGLITPFLPEWDAVRSRPQRNAFHRWTVDRHLLETVARACGSVRDVRRPDLLLIAALLHDIGKGLPGDHTDNGIVVADVITTRMGFDPVDVALVGDLVRFHLLLPSVATGRDLSDPATADAVADAVGSEEVLELLAALTEADSLATGPTAWTPWKAELMERLVRVTRTSLRREPHPAAPPDAHWAFDAARRFAGALVVEPRDHGVTIVAPDALGLLALEVTTLGVHGQDVRAARTYTVDGVAVGDFTVEARHPTPPDWERFAEDLRLALADPDAIAARLADRADRYGAVTRPTAARSAAPRVVVDNRASSTSTIFEVRAADGIGVLAAMTGAFASLGLRVDQAYVSTLGHEAVDSFYVTDGAGAKIEAPATIVLVESTVLSALGVSESRQTSDQVR